MPKRSRGNGIWYWASIFVIVLVALFFRLWHLDRIPTGIVGDELDYVLNAKSIYHTGKSIVSDTWSPYSLTTVPEEVPKAELPYFVSLPFVGPFGLSLFTSRIGYALLSVVFVLVVFATASHLFGSAAGLVAGFLAAVNPWSVYYGRTAYDVPVAITAYLFAFYLLLRLRGPALLWAVIPLFIAFYSYIGTKVLFLPFVLVTLVGLWLTVHQRKHTRWLIAIAIISAGIFLHFALSLRGLDAGVRTSQIFTPFDPTVAHAVDTQRRLSIPSPLTFLFANKPVVYAKLALTKFLGAFSPSLLFTNGEGIATFSLWEHGLFYPVDMLFLIISIAVLLLRMPKMLTVFSVIIALSTMPSVLSTVGTSYVHRSSLMYPFLIMLVGYGIHAVYRATSGAIRAGVVCLIVMLYGVAVVNFAHLYFFRFPLYNSESFGLSQRIYSRYMALADRKNIPVSNISFSSVGYFRNYVFYTDALTHETAPQIRKAIAEKSFTWKTSRFTDQCPTKADIAAGETTYILSDTSPCKQLFIKKPMIAIATLSDGGSLYMIFNDKLCTPHALPQYPTGLTMEDLDIEHLDEQTFCEKYLVQYQNPLYLPQGKDGAWITQ